MMMIWARGLVTAKRSTAAASFYAGHHWKNASRHNIKLFSSKQQQQQQKEPPSTQTKRDAVVVQQQSLLSSNTAAPPTTASIDDDDNADSTTVLTFFRAVYVHPISKMVLKRIQEEHILADMNHSLSIVPPNGTFCLTFKDHIIQRVSTIFDASKQAHYLQVDYKNQKKSKRVLLSQGNGSSKPKHETLQDQIHSIVDESLGTTNPKPNS